MNIILEFVEKIKNVYLPGYFQWLTGQLSNSDPMVVLSFAVMVTFALVIYVWFRNRE